MLLPDRVAVVTGTGPNIGGEIARLLAREGARVACFDANGERALEVAKAIQHAGGSAIGVEVDITDEQDVSRAFASVDEAFGHVDILVNNAAITHRGTILDTTLEEWGKVIDVILTGTFLCGREAARRMVAAGNGGSIVNICSTSGHRGGVRAIAYATAKAGLLNFTRSMAIQLAPHRIRVNSVTPTQTGIPVGEERSREDEGPPRNIPLGRWGRPVDQAQAVLFLVSPHADFITGIDLPVDGGLLASIPKG